MSAADHEFQKQVVGALARLETKVAAVETCTAEQKRDLAAVVRFQNRALGAISAVSVVASAAFSFAISATKHFFSDK